MGRRRRPRLHVVDLDGARAGAPLNLEHVGRIAGEVDVPVQVGGGLRTIAVAQRRRRSRRGPSRDRNRRLYRRRLPGRGRRGVTAIGSSCRSTPATDCSPRPAGPSRPRSRWSPWSSGWAGAACAGSSTRASTTTACWPGPTSTERSASPPRSAARFIYSGGIASLDDIRSLVALRQVNLSGVIVGKALYEGRFTVGEAQQALDH